MNDSTSPKPDSHDDFMLEVTIYCFTLGATGLGLIRILFGQLVGNDYNATPWMVFTLITWTAGAIMTAKAVSRIRGHGFLGPRRQDG